MKLIDINIQNYGLIKGRDSINIVGMTSSDPRKIEIIASISSNSLPDKASVKNGYKYLKITFSGVVLYKIFDENIRGLLSDEEFCMHEKSDAESIFMEVIDSNLVNKNENKILRHLILETYDFKIESLCENIIIEDFIDN